MANGQFAVADIPGAINRGLQFRQQEQLRPLQQQQAQQQIDRGNQQFQLGQQQLQQGQQAISENQRNLLNQEAVDLSALIKSTPRGQRAAAFEKRKQQKLNLDPNADTSDLDVFIGLANNGKHDELDQTAKNGLTFGKELGLRSTKPQELELKQEAQQIRRQEAELRSSEAEERKLDRQLKRETNEIKRQELETKVEAAKTKVEQGKRDTKFNADSAVTAVDNSISTIDRLLSGDALESAAGFQANFPTVSGTKASGFEAALDTLQSQAFLSEIEKMKGLGALSENEGKKLAQAVGSLTINQPDKQLRAELNRIRVQMTKAKSKLRAKFGEVTQPQVSGDFSGQSNEQLLSF